MLQGVRVVEIGSFITAPLAGMLLGDLGAEVIKVERPEGDPFRGSRGGIYSPNFVAINRNKRSIALDFGSESDKAVLLRCIDRAMCCSTISGRERWPRQGSIRSGFQRATVGSSTVPSPASDRAVRTVRDRHSMPWGRH